MRRLGLTGQIVAALLLSAALGSAYQALQAGGWLGPDAIAWLKTWFFEGLLQIGGKIFIASLKLLVVPLVLVSLASGAASLGDLRSVGRLGLRTLILFTATTAIAIIIAILVAEAVAPGSGHNLRPPVAAPAPTPPSFKEVLINIFPDNPVRAMADGNMLQIIVFALLLGGAIAKSGEKGQAIQRGLLALNDVLLELVSMLVQLAPFGVFCLLLPVFADRGAAALGPLAAYFFTVLAALLLHASLTYSFALALLARLNPLDFFRKMRPVMLFAFSISSSNATLPLNMSVTEKRLGVSNSVASFVLPLGATINMDGTAIMQGVATVFIAQVYGIDLSVAQLATVVAMAVLASIGTAGVPGVGLITLTMVLAEVGLPVEGVALIIGVDRLLDMTRTAVNICGDAMTACIVARSVGALDLELYRDHSQQMLQPPAP
ncbi:MAG: dicarboxylate/amino acid:cation symporter [Leptospirales bacterium]|nr:dicarboxylate/amino acid:cation symporter [Leptospirales bacterium]